MKFNIAILLAVAMAASQASAAVPQGAVKPEDAATAALPQALTSAPQKLADLPAQAGKLGKAAEKAGSAQFKKAASAVASTPQKVADLPAQAGKLGKAAEKAGSAQFKKAASAVASMPQKVAELPAQAGKFADAAKVQGTKQFSGASSQAAKTSKQVAAAPSQAAGLLPEQITSEPGKLAAAGAYYASEAQKAGKAGLKALADGPAYLASLPAKAAKVGETGMELVDAAKPDLPTAKDFCQTDDDGDRVGFCSGNLKPSVTSDGETESLLRRDLIKSDFLEALCQQDDSSDEVGFCHGLVPDAKLGDLDAVKEVMKSAASAGGKRAENDFFGLIEKYAPNPYTAITSLVAPCEKLSTNQNAQKVPGFEGLCKETLPDADEQAVAATSGGGLVVKRQVDHGVKKAFEGSAKGIKAGKEQVADAIEHPPSPEQVLQTLGATLVGGLSKSLPNRKRQVDYGIKKGFQGSAKGIKASEEQIEDAIEHPPTPEQVLQLLGSTLVGGVSKSLPNRRRQVGLEMLLPCVHGEKDLHGEAGFCNSLIPSAHERDVMAIVRRHMQAKMHSRFVKRTQRF